MGDSYGNSQQNENIGNKKEIGRTGFRNARGPGMREGGGFRIRLSDNEMRASRAIQEAFNLRSTVAVLGFAVRTLAQLLEEGKLDEIISQYRSQTPKGGSGFNNQRNKSGNSNNNSKQHKPNPFARPEKPQTNSNQAPNENKDLDLTEPSDIEISTQENSETAEKQAANNETTN